MHNTLRFHTLVHLKTTKRTVGLCKVVTEPQTVFWIPCTKEWDTCKHTSQIERFVMFSKIAASVNLENGLNPGIPYVFRINSYPLGGWTKSRLNHWVIYYHTSFDSKAGDTWFNICWSTNAAPAVHWTNVERCAMPCWILKYAIQLVERCWTKIETRSTPFNTSVQHCSTFVKKQILQDVEPCVIGLKFKWAQIVIASH